jgi:hypothetical protein
MAKKDSGRMTWKSGDKEVFWAKEDDPIYKRGWMISPAKSARFSEETSDGSLRNMDQDFPGPDRD